MLKAHQFFQRIHLAAFIILVLTGQKLEAQIITSSSTNTVNWECRLQSGKNATPLPFATVMDGDWTGPVQGNTWPQECQHPPINSYPGGQPITTPGNLDCSYEGNYTSFFRTTMTLPNANPICEAFIDVRADNFFRLWVNGVLVSNSFADDPAPLGGTCEGSSVATGVTGNGYQLIIRVNIASFINFNSLTQSIVFEVANCDYFNYLSANAVVKQRVVPGPNPNINFILNSDNILTLWGTPNGWSNQSWLLEQSSSFNGPWSFYSFNSNSRPGASFSVIIPKCVFIRITHTVWYFCGGEMVSATAQHILNSCGGGFAGENVGNLIDEIPDRTVKAMSENPDTYREDYIQSSIASFDPHERKIIVKFNESLSLESDMEVMLTSVEGRVARLINSEQIMDNEILEIDALDLKAGIYFITVDNGGNKKTHKVLVTN